MKMVMESKCEKCGTPQEKVKGLSNPNWNVYDCTERCECGGKFVMYMNGKKVSDYE